MQVSVQRLRVLLVDDEPLIRKGLSSLIDWEAEGYQIAGEASNGNSAINLLKQNDYDLIISNINMPEMDGIELISYVKENKLSKARFVLLSGYNDYQYAKTAMQYQLKLDTATCIIDHIENEIEENYAEGLSLKSLGEKYYINSAYLGQIFKKKYGCSFKDHLNNVRIRKAAELLLNTDKEVYEIAVDVGYKNQEYFINKFEEIYKVTPTRLRKRNLK